MFSKVAPKLSGVTGPWSLPVGGAANKVLTYSPTAYGKTFWSSVPNSIAGTLNRVTASAPTGAVTLDISASYVGQSSITTLGTITTGVWNGTAITYANLQNATALSVLGRSANTSGVLADLVASSDGDVLRRSGTSVGFGSIVLAASNFGNPSSPGVDLVGANGVAVTAMRSDAKLVLDQTIAPTWTAQHSFTGVIGFDLTSTQPRILFDENDRGTDLRKWEWLVSGGVFIRTMTDAGAAGENAYVILRGATTAVASHTFRTANVDRLTISTTLLTSALNVTAPSYTATSGTIGLTVSNAQPRFKFSETDQGADLKNWEYLGSGGSYFIRTTTDADGAGENAYIITRGTTTVVDSHTWRTANTDRVILNSSGQLTISNGTAALPALALINSATTGLYRSAADVIGFSAAATLRVSISSTALLATADNYEIQLGTGTAGVGDLRLYHDGTNSFIRNDTGAFRIQKSTTVLEEMDTNYVDCKVRPRRTGGSTPAALASGNNNDYSIAANIAEVRLTPNAAGSTITGIANPTAGDQLRLWNIDTAVAIVLSHADTNSTAANRFLLASGTNTTIQPGGCADLSYDGTSARWRQINRVA